MYCKPTDAHSYLLHSSSHPNHVKNSIPFSQFLRLRRLCSDEIDFSNKSEEMLQFFKNRGYPKSVVKTAQERAQTTNQQSAPQTSQKEENQRIPFTLSCGRFARSQSRFARKKSQFARTKSRFAQTKSRFARTNKILDNPYVLLA